MIKKMFLGLVIYLGLFTAASAWALDYTYTESGGEITITGYTGSGGDIVIPDTIEEMPVVTIRSYAFYICSSLFSITIPDSVTRIGDYAFGGCSSLMRITIPNSVTSIGYRAFANCLSLTRITIPNSVTYIESRAFERCTSLTSASFLGNAPSMESYVFDNCAPDFSIYYTSEAAGFTTPTWEGYPTANCPDDFFYTVSEGQATITDYQGCGDIVIPSEIDGMPVVSIGDVAFRENTSLTSVTIPDSVTSIGVSTFYGCSGLTSVNIPNSVTSIGGSAFHNCSALTSVTIPNSVTSIGQRAFYNCSALTSVIIPNSVTIIREFLFYGCSGLTSITIPNKVIVIQDFAFYGCSGLTSVTIGKVSPSSPGTHFMGVPLCPVHIFSEMHLPCLGQIFLVTPHLISAFATLPKPKALQPPRGKAIQQQIAPACLTVNAKNARYALRGSACLPHSPVSISGPGWAAWKHQTGPQGTTAPRVCRMLQMFPMLAGTALPGQTAQGTCGYLGGWMKSMVQHERPVAL